VNAFNLCRRTSISVGVCTQNLSGHDAEPDANETVRAVVDADALLNALIAQEAVGITIVDRDLRIVRANRAFGIFGDRSLDEVAGRPIGDVLPHLAAQIVPETQAVLETGRPVVGQEVVAEHPTDPARTRWFRAHRSPVVARSGEIVGVTSTVMEITDLKRAQIERDDALARQRESTAAETASRRSESEALRRYNTIFAGTSMGILRADEEGRLIEANPAVEQMLGYTAAELLTMEFAEYTHPDDVDENVRLFHEIMDGTRDAYQFEKRCFRKDGEMVWIRVASVAERDEETGRSTSISMLENITERKLAEQARARQAKLNEHQALHDALTGLANRRKLHFDIEHALDIAAPTDSFALGVFDLDGFKAYNDVFGHPAGDALLERLARRLREAIGDHATAYRMGGDEFCVFIESGPFDEIMANAQIALSEQGDGFTIRCSRGATLIPAEATTLERAIQVADERLYQDKRANRVVESRDLRDALVQMISEQRADQEENVLDLADLAAATATNLGLSSEDVACTRVAAELHDIGKSAMPEEILQKAGPLDSEEWAFMWRHTLIGERIVAAAPALARIAPIVRASHERPDGNGYPDGLLIEEIPIGARIVAVVDAFSAMISDRSYRDSLTVDQAIHELRRCAGTQFDHAVVDAFAQVIARAENARRAA
jgi:diguanylate cyclase (GGDEF)-like protein/PAS domain S-box-containing protein